MGVRHTKHSVVRKQVLRGGMPPGMQRCGTEGGGRVWGLKSRGGEGGSLPVAHPRAVRPQQVEGHDGALPPSCGEPPRGRTGRRRRRAPCSNACCAGSLPLLLLLLLLPLLLPAVAVHNHHGAPIEVPQADQLLHRVPAAPHARHAPHITFAARPCPPCSPCSVLPGRRPLAHPLLLDLAKPAPSLPTSHLVSPATYVCAQPSPYRLSA